MVGWLVSLVFLIVLGSFLGCKGEVIGMYVLQAMASRKVDKNGNRFS